jgi:hypothetical protein
LQRNSRRGREREPDAQIRTLEDPAVAGEEVEQRSLDATIGHALRR